MSYTDREYYAVTAAAAATTTMGKKTKNKAKAARKSKATTGTADVGAGATESAAHTKQVVKATMDGPAPVPPIDSPMSNEDFWKLPEALYKEETWQNFKNILLKHFELNSDHPQVDEDAMRIGVLDPDPEEELIYTPTLVAHQLFCYIALDNNGCFVDDTRVVGYCVFPDVKCGDEGKPLLVNLSKLTLFEIPAHMKAHLGLAEGISQIYLVRARIKHDKNK